MKGSQVRQRCTLAAGSRLSIEPKVKYMSVMIFEKQGKAIIQPLATEEEANSLKELLKTDTLEVWLPNGKADPEQFDISILKYQQLMQPSTACSRNENIVCLKNHFETIVSCDQCPLGANGVSD